MLKKWGFAILGVIFLLALIGNVKAEEEYGILSKKICPVFGVDENCFEPKISCNPDYSSCAIVTYDEGTYLGWGKGIKVLYSTDGFTSDIRVYSISACAMNISDEFRNYSFSYDIQFNPNDNKYYIIAPDTAGSGCQKSAGLWTFDVLNGVVFKGYFNSQDGFKFYNWQPIGIIKKDTANPEAVIILGTCGDSIISECGGLIKLQRYYLYNRTVITGDIINYTATACASNGVGTQFYFARGFSYYLTSQNYYDLIVKWNCGNSQIFTFSPNLGNDLRNIANLPDTNRTGFSYYSSGNLIYTRKEGVYSVPTTTFSSWGSSSLYYTFRTDNNETIRLTSIDSATGHQLYSYEIRSTNTTGVYFYDKPLIPINIFALTTDPISLATNYTNMIATAKCLNTGYTATSSYAGGGQYIVNIACNTNMSLTFDATDGKPSSFTYIFDLPSGCTSYNFALNYIKSPYSLPFKVIDSISSDPIPNANITFGSTVYTTNSYGIANINVTPFSTSSFRTSQVSCKSIFYTNGTAQSTFITSIANNYKICNSEEQGCGYQIFVTPDLIYEPIHTIRLNINGVTLNVHVYSADSYEINTTGVGTVIVNGANTTIWYHNGINRVNNAYAFPATFALVDNRSSYLINLTLTYGNTTYTTFFISGVNYTSFNVTTGNDYNVIFFLDQNLRDIPCQTADDCTTNHCENLDYEQLNGCNNGFCDYTATTCSLYCDGRVGCYDAQTSQDCSSDFDCNSTCLSNGLSLTGLCGADGFCKGKKTLCTAINATTGLSCNNGTGRCPETDLCFAYGGEQRYRFLLQSTDVPLQWFSTANFTTYSDVSFYCGLNNMGQRRCVSGQQIVKTPDIVAFATIPDNWKYTFDTNTNTYTFYDIATYCDVACNVTYQYCPFGCNPSVGLCYNQPTSSQGQINNVLAGFASFLNNTFPDMNSRMLVVIIITISVVVSITYLLNRVNHSSNWQVALGTMIVMILTAAFVGWFDPLVTILFIIAAGYILIRFSQLWQAT